MNQVRQISPCLSFGTRLITFDKTSTGDAGYGPNVIEAVTPFLSSTNAIQLFFESLRSKSARITSPTNLTEFEVSQLIALIHLRQRKVAMIQDFCHLSPAWTNEIMKAIQSSGFFSVLGTNGHKGIESRHVSKLFNQMAVMVLHQWLLQANLVKDVQSASIDEIEEHLLRIDDMMIAIHAISYYKMAVLAAIHAGIHSLVCSECNFGKLLPGIVTRLMDNMDREVMMEEFPCGEKVLAVHTKFPGMTKISVPSQYRLSAVFDAPDKKTQNDKVSGIGMRMIPAGYSHLVAYESVELVRPTSYYHIDCAATVGSDTTVEAFLSMDIPDAHVHIWNNNAGTDVVPVSSTNPVIRELLNMVPGENLQSVKLPIVLLALIDSMTVISIQIKGISASRGELCPVEWSSDCNDIISKLYRNSKLPNLASVRSGMAVLTSREAELVKTLVLSLAADAFKVVEVGQWEFTQRFLKQQVDAIKSMVTDIEYIENEYYEYVAALRDFINQ